MDRSDIKRLAVPSSGQLTVALAAALALFIFTNLSLITGSFSSSFLNDPYFQESYRLQLSRLDDVALVRTATIITFWSIIGLVAYTVIWAVMNTLIEARNEMVLQTEYVNKPELSERMRAPLLQLGVGLILIISLVISGKLLLPLWLSWFGVFLLGGFHLVGFVALVVSLLAAAANLYLLWALLRLMLLIN